MKKKLIKLTEMEEYIRNMYIQDSEDKEAKKKKEFY